MSEWDEYAGTWDDSSATRAYADAAFESLMAVAEVAGVPVEDAAVCDFGSGTGLLTERLADHGARVDAVDTSAGMREVLERKIAQRGWRHVRQLEQLPSEPHGYDLIVCSSVLSFVEDYPAAVRSLFARLRPGGLFVQWDWERDPDGTEPGGLAAADISRTLRNAGFEQVAVGVGFEVAVDGDTMRPLMGHGLRPN